MDKTCTTCGETKSEEEFYLRVDRPGKRKAICIPCDNTRSATWYANNRDRRAPALKANKEQARERARLWVFKYLLEHPCVDCGECDPVVLEFDHLRDKENDVTNMVSNGLSVAKIEREIEKCEVVCCNCHRRRTATRGNHFKYNMVSGEPLVAL